MYEQKETSQHRKQKLQTKRNTHIYISQYIYIYIEREREREGLMLGTQSFLNY